MSLTTAQQAAIAARGNVLVMAGAGTGKTSTLVERCIACLSGPTAATLDQLLIVTFTEAAAAEARERIRAKLEQAHLDTKDPHWAQQLALFDAAAIGTLHAFCFKLVRQHFYQLGLDPQVSVLDEGQARLLEEETLTDLLEEHYAATAPEAAAVLDLIETYAHGQDATIRELVQKIFHYSQTQPDPQDWFARQRTLFTAATPTQWREWLLAGIAEWRELWLAELDRLAPENPKAAECLQILRSWDNEAAPAGATPSDTATPAEAQRSPGAVFEEIILAKNGPWPPRRKEVLRKPLLGFFEDADFLATVLSSAVIAQPRVSENGEADDAEESASESVLSPAVATKDPLIEDWERCRGSMLALLELTAQFTARFATRKRADSVLDFHDLEQFAIELLWEQQIPSAPALAPSLTPEPEPPKRRGRARRDDSQQLALDLFNPNTAVTATPVWGPSRIAQQWREKLRFVFVDEYQDINAAQDRIITALSREAADANRFLVGDVKQSIYRFRLSDPRIFRGYARDWRGLVGTTIALAENFRSRPAILEFANSIFTPLMHESIGGVTYDSDARLIPGLDATTLPAAPEPDVELRFRLAERTQNPEGDDLEDLRDSDDEARHVALRLLELKDSGRQILDRVTKQHRPIEWRDMAVLLRAPSGKADAFAKQFDDVGVPLLVERGGFFETLEIADLHNLLRLLDNPLQDVPLLAVLRSPLVGLSLDELATIRLTARGQFWTALTRWAQTLPPHPADKSIADDLRTKVTRFLERFARWRQLARHAALSKCLDTILAETHYAEWLRAQEGGAQRYANVQRLLGLAEQYDQFQRQGLFRFLRFITAQSKAGAEPDLAAASSENAVRLMSIHQSKGLEFPVVVVADLGKKFNKQDIRAEIILDEQYGLCPMVYTPERSVRYPSAVYWLARRHQERELLGEELRLLYVALTRAREKLILIGSVSRKRWETLAEVSQITPLRVLAATSTADWIRLWLATHSAGVADHFDFQELNNTTAAEAGTAEEIRPQAEAMILDEPTQERLRRTLTWEYPSAAATHRAAKTSVTALRRAAAEELEAETILPPSFVRPARKEISTSFSATDVGNVHHRFLQHVALDQAADLAGLRREADRMGREWLLTAEETAVLDFAALEQFWRSPVGTKIRARAADVKRELPFTARFAPTELDHFIGRPAAATTPISDDFVIVQGVADLVVVMPDELWLLDFKTDNVSKTDIPARLDYYAPQLRLYAQALQRIFGRRVTECWLHFLACNETVALETGG